VDGAARRPVVAVVGAVMIVAPSTPSRVEDARLRQLFGDGTIHFMGIGGAGMSALAEAIARRGGRVTGCDAAPGIAAEPLSRLGIPVHEAHDPAHLEGVSTLIVTAAVPADHPEIVEARRRGIPVVKRASALGAWVSEGVVIAIGGTHGKTTTTAMATEILARAGMDPTGFVGGWVPAWKGHLRAGRDDLFVVEADEYDRSFHHLRPSVALVTNMEPDHLDIYGDFAGVRDGFRTFLDQVRPDGTVLVCADDPGASALVAGVRLETRTYGVAPGSQLRGVEAERAGAGTRFRILEDGMDRGRVQLGVPGMHNLKNALGAVAAARSVGVEWSAVRAALEAFEGVARRFQRLGDADGVLVIDDYAHHPTELVAAIAAARAAHPDRRLVAVFQPHLFTRTRDFAGEFGRVLATADAVWITEVYPAREEPIPGVDAAYLARRVVSAALRAGGPPPEVRVHAEVATLAEALAAELGAGDLCLTLGAGSIDRVGPELVRRLEARDGEGADA
jgi:UDP-N-acetylmuramate--alanine ligase